MSSDKVVLSEKEWKAKLTPFQYKVLREKGTERAFTGEYDKFFEDGIYVCAGCGAELYTAEQKFKSGCGWPAFYDNVKGAVKQYEDTSHGMTRTEIVCARCEGHLGHVFKGEGYKTPTNSRHCVNSVSIKFIKKQ
eukprot:TRINITY_DN1839_c0_g1_i1.p1 TRINITY_DN1839_c0_g1~~TRINITY_DN1839_c0_g1_i1.p1  ORF type:complete len:135 (-),score=26.30 TRINITY_DN1839_c0_g1_i1:19-423(-)